MRPARHLAATAPHGAANNNHADTTPRGNPMLEHGKPHAEPSQRRARKIRALSRRNAGASSGGKLRETWPASTTTVAVAFAAAASTCEARHAHTAASRGSTSHHSGGGQQRHLHTLESRAHCASHAEGSRAHQGVCLRWRVAHTAPATPRTLKHTKNQARRCRSHSQSWARVAIRINLSRSRLSAAGNGGCEVGVLRSVATQKNMHSVDDTSGGARMHIDGAAAPSGLGQRA